MAGKTKNKTKRVNRSPQELLQAEYEKSQLKAMADDDGYLDALVSQAPPVIERLPRRVPAPMPDPASVRKVEARESQRDFVRGLRADSSIALTVAEVCQLLKISRSTLYRADLPGKVTIGGCVRYDKNQIMAWWFEQQKQPSP